MDPRLPALRADPAGLHAVHASDGRRRVGRLSRDGAELVPGGPARRRPHRLRALRPTPPRHRQGDGLGAAALRSRLVPVELPRQRRRRGDRAGVVAELVCVGGPDLVPRRFPPYAAPRRPLAALTGPPTGRSRLSRPARPDAAARRHPLDRRAAASLDRVVGPPAATRPSSKKPATKKRPTAMIAARWLPERSHDTRPKTTGPSTAPVLPTRA